MIMVESKAIVLYTCTLTSRDEDKIRQYADLKDVSLNTAICGKVEK